MDEKEILLSKYNQSLQAHIQAMDTIFELKYLLQKAEEQNTKLTAEIEQKEKQ